jgi:hypothetical protein
MNNDFIIVKIAALAVVAIALIIFLIDIIIKGEIPL